MVVVLSMSRKIGQYDFLTLIVLACVVAPTEERTTEEEDERQGYLYDSSQDLAMHSI
jgi:hypothetical protein